jgi:crotonobetainyl-CoA:carnitine CoA-transferase CaiB-like acyl-CoA transferase
VLAAEADVLIENFKLGGLAKYGLDYESLRRGNPGLIYCSITALGKPALCAPRRVRLHYSRYVRHHVRYRGT